LAKCVSSPQGINAALRLTTSYPAKLLVNSCQYLHHPAGDGAIENTHMNVDQIAQRIGFADAAVF
jgi:hypothetical protein